MGKGHKHSRVQDRKYFNVSREVVDGRQVFKSTVQTDSKDLVQLGVFSSPVDAARAADLATLALGRRGPLNYVKQCYLQKDVEREKEKLRQAGILPREPRKRKTAGRSKQQSDQGATGKGQPSKRAKGSEQQAPAVTAHEEEEEQGQPPAGVSKGSRKRKATSPGADVAAAAATASGRARDQQRQPGHAEEGSRPKRRRTQAAAQQGSPPTSGPEQAPTHQTRSRQHSPAAAAPVNTALVPAAPRAAIMPTGGTVQLGAPGSVSQEILLVQLRSALAAHEHSKQQLRAALNALEASEGQLAAVAHATGLQL